VRNALAKRPPAAELAERILARDQAQYRRVQETQGPVFFDRSLVDALGMCEELALSSTVRLAAMLKEYPFHRAAFVFHPWPDICAMDAERDQTSDCLKSVGFEEVRLFGDLLGGEFGFHAERLVALAHK
jgi:predicted ATPase